MLLGFTTIPKFLFSYLPLIPHLWNLKIKRLHENTPRSVGPVISALDFYHTFLKVLVKYRATINWIQRGIPIRRCQ